MLYSYALLSLLLTANNDPEIGIGSIFQDCSQCPEMIVIPAGTFMMGDPGNWYSRRHERPQHEVSIPKPLAVGRFEVTFAEWDTCVEDGGCGGHRPDDFGFGRGKRPVFNVSWNAVQSYISWLNTKSPNKYRLLTEAEWEYMARAGTTTDYTTGQNITANQASFDDNPHNTGSGKSRRPAMTTPVGSFTPNLFGIYDVEGNVGEYTQDCWHENYEGAPSDGRAWIENGNCEQRVARSGAWGAMKDEMRTSSRGSFHIYRTSVSYGFRLARDLK